MNYLSSIKKIIMGLLVITIIGGILDAPSRAHAQLPTINIPILTSPYILDSVGIQRNATNTWDVPFFVPPNTRSLDFALQVNGTTLTGIPQAQLLNGRLVFKVPDASFTVGGTALIGLIQKNPLKVVSLDAVMVLAQGLQLSQFRFNQQALVQNSDGSWNIGYSIPLNTVVSEYALTIGSNPPLTNGLAGYGGMIFKVPESWFNSGSSLTLTLTHIPTGRVVATNIVFVPVSGPSPYILDQTTIKQNTAGVWDVGYTVPTNTNARHFSLQINNGSLITNGAIVSGRLVFKVPKDSLVPGSQAVLVLKNETTGQIRASDTITVPSGIGGLFILDFPPTKNTNGNWRVSYSIPPNTAAASYELLVGTNEVSVAGGAITNSKLVFEVPESLFSNTMASSVFLLKNKNTGRAYRADGTEFTHSAPPGNTSYPAGALRATFPTSGQTIGQNQISVTIKLTVQKDIPSVNTTYIWKNKNVSSPNDTAKELVKTAPTATGVKSGSVRDVPITFPNLQPGQTYNLSIQDVFTSETIGEIEFTTKDQTGAGGGVITPPTTNDPSNTDQGSSGNIISVESGKTTSSDSCTGEDCYETFSGLNEALGSQFSSFTNAEDLTGFINALIGFAIGIAGVLAVIMIMYEGFLYMSTDNVATKGTARSRIVSTVAGFVLLLSIYTLLRTINPDLLVVMPKIDAVTLEQIPDRSNDVEFQQNLDDLGGETIPDTTDYNDEVFITYLYHQQGEGGAPSILWAAKKGYATVPATTPFIKGTASRINNNMANNVNKSDMKKLIGTDQITPSNFLKYWRKKVEAAKQSSAPVTAGITSQLQKVSIDTGVSFTTLRAMCIIESRCKSPAADTCNSSGYCGLFQLSQAVFKKFGKGTNIFDYYSNIYAGARYSIYHKQKYSNHRSRIN